MAKPLESNMNSVKVEVVAIGNELLSGTTVNSNAAFISHLLLEKGYQVVRHTVLPDQPAQLHAGLQEALKRSHLVITTGGLGPTCDDITRKIAAELFQSDFHLDEEIAAELRTRICNQPDSVIDQATVPSKAKVLKNKIGTAPGLIFSDETSTLILLPGVPHEMKALFTEQVIPYLAAALPLKIKRFARHLNLFSLPEIAVDGSLRELEIHYPGVEFGIYPGLGLLNIHLVTMAESEEKADLVLNPPFQILRTRFKPYLFESPSGRLENAVHEKLIEKKATLSLAESCTGGAVASRLAQLPGASKYLLGSIVAYSNLLKSSLLSVPDSLLLQAGAVSPEVVASMLEGLFARTGSDYGIAVTGIAGPDGGTPEKPVGTVWCAVGQRGKKPKVWKLMAYGTRPMVIEKSVNALLGELYQQITSVAES